jgi:hypothetical protein
LEANAAFGALICGRQTRGPQKHGRIFVWGRETSVSRRGVSVSDDYVKSMSALVIAYAVLGTTLGLKYKVVILVPTIIGTLITVPALSAVFGIASGHALTGTIGAILAVQFGYLVGAAMRPFGAAAADAHATLRNRDIKTYAFVSWWAPLSAWITAA